MALGGKSPGQHRQFVVHLMLVLRAQVPVLWAQVSWVQASSAAGVLQKINLCLQPENMLCIELFTHMSRV